MIDEITMNTCQKNINILNIKINNLEYAIQEIEKIIAESSLDDKELKLLRRKVASSINDLEALYLIKKQFF